MSPPDRLRALTVVDRICTWWDVSGGRYKMGTFRRLTGVSAETLRAWERRHGLLSPARGEGGHRLYTDEDLRVMRRVLQLVAEGRAIGEIASLGRDALLAAEVDPADVEPAERARAWCDRIVGAATRIDRHAVSLALDEVFASLSVRAAVRLVVEPVAVEIGARWARGEITVAGEHLVSTAMLIRLHRLLEVASTPGSSSAPVVCAGLPGEDHVLGLLVVALHVASSSIPVLYLGPSVPIPDLEHAMTAVSPRAVCLTATRSTTLDASEAPLAAMARRWSDRTPIYLGGQGIAGAERLTDAGVVVWPSGRSLSTLGDELRGLA